MPHVVCYGTPVQAISGPAQARLKQRIKEAMVAVSNAGFELRQIRLSIPVESERDGYDHEPFIHARFGPVEGRSEETLRAVCDAVARVICQYFSEVGDVREVQYSWHVDDMGRFGRFPEKS